jgi:outer membrane lipoprotein-sorting protein
MINLKKHSRQIVRLSLASLLIAALLLVSACGQKANNSAADNSANGTGPYRKSLNVADQAAAIRTLQTIYSAQTQYMLSHGEEYGTFDQLAQENYLDQRFKGTSPIVEGYVFTMKVTPKSGSASAMYAVNADPKEENPANATGAQHLYLDATSNVVHGNATRPATANDPPLSQ